MLISQDWFASRGKLCRFIRNVFQAKTNRESRSRKYRLQQESKIPQAVASKLHEESLPTQYVHEPWHSSSVCTNITWQSKKKKKLCLYPNSPVMVHLSLISVSLRSALSLPTQNVLASTELTAPLWLLPFGLQPYSHPLFPSVTPLMFNVHSSSLQTLSSVA